MKVKEILEKLQNVDPDTEVQFNLLEGCCGDKEVLSGDLEVHNMPGNTHDVRFVFDQLPGYETCKKAGQMHELASKLSYENTVSLDGIEISSININEEEVVRVGDTVLDDLTGKYAKIKSIQLKEFIMTVGIWLDNDYLDGGRYPWEITAIGSKK